MRVVVLVPGPAHQLGDQGHAEPGETDHPAAVQVGPEDHYQREVVDRAAAAVQITLEPVQLETAERECDHLRARAPDRRAGDRADREADADEDERLAPDLEVDQPEAGPCQQAECDAERRQPERAVGQPHQHLGQVFVVGPDVAGYREGEEVLGRQMPVLRHPASDPQVPPEVGVLLDADEKDEDHDHHAPKQQRPSREALGHPQGVSAERRGSVCSGGRVLHIRDTRLERPARGCAPPNRCATARRSRSKRSPPHSTSRRWRC